MGFWVNPRLLRVSWTYIYIYHYLFNKILIYGGGKFINMSLQVFLCVLKSILTGIISALSCTFLNTLFLHPHYLLSLSSQYNIISESRFTLIFFFLSEVQGKFNVFRQGPWPHILKICLCEFSVMFNF
jgi:hypothetical protein